MAGAGISALSPTVGLSGLPDPLGDATAALEARRRQQVTGAGYDPDKGLYDRYSEMLSFLGPTIAERSRAAADAMRRGDMATYQKIATDLSMDFGNFLGSIKPIRAYHGSPHDFDKFDMSKIGTGEGAQAYGHGLYFAENEGVARSYRDALAKRDNPRLQHMAAKALGGDVGMGPDMMVFDAAARSADLREFRSILESHVQRGLKKDPNGYGHWEAVLLDKAMRSGRLDKYYEMAAPELRGRMYEVNIHADPERFLDWDAPIQNLPDDVVSAARSVGARPRGGWEASALEPNVYYRKGERGTEGSVRLIRGWREDIPDQWIAEYDTGLSRGSQKFDSMDLAQRWIDTEAPIEAGRGADVVREMQRRMSDAQVTDALREAGIPGIKYLDQGSRAAGDGSRNYVVFDDKLIEILRKYGIMAPVAGLGALAASGQDDPNL